MPRRISLAVDIGGTFTDIVLLAGDSVFTEKTLTTPDDLLRGFFAGIGVVLGRAGLAPGDVNGVIVHATTVVTNALIERKGARTAMVFTEGFPDILRIRDERRYDVYDPQIEFQRPLVGTESIFTLKERIFADGGVERGIDAAEVMALAARLAERSIESVGICFLHSYKNGDNERRAAELLRQRLNSLFVSISCDVAPQIREYFRASTTAANAYAVPITRPYLGRLEASLAERGFSSRPLIMLSSGGVVGPKVAGDYPVRMIESGPAAGALAAAFAAAELKLANLLAFDMGGTTAKVCLVQDYRPLVAGAFEIDRINRFKEGSGLPISVPCIDMIEIGAGGGSIAHVGALGLLNVGPRSAGSRPGPACYGLGGSDPTVTDADVVLGVIDAGNFLGGAMPLDAAAAEAAVGRLAREIGTTTLAAARGVFRVVCEAMAGAVRAHAGDRGINYRDTPLLAFGGAGPVHACEVAELLSSRTVIFPPHASVLSAMGSLVSPTRLDLVHTSLALLDELDWDRVGALLGELEAKGRRALGEAGCPERAIAFAYAADVRYCGQHFELTVDLGAKPDAATGAVTIRRRYEEEYAKRYKLVQSDVAIEVVTWRVTASGPSAAAPRFKANGAAETWAPRAREVHLWADRQDVSVVRRAALPCGKTIAGPFIIEEPDTTLVVPPGWTATLGASGYIAARRQG
jgi:N-methylhydantoinase A